MKQTARQRERQQALEARYDERALCESHDVAKHVMRSPLAMDDDPELGYYDYDHFGGSA